MWFEELTGFREKSPQQVHEHITVHGQTMKSHVNGRTFACGLLETPSLAELRKRVRACELPEGKIKLRAAVADVKHLHADPANAGSLFQVASQFNLLEMVSPDRTPEAGVGIYQHDHTQGPACAVAAGAGTIYRNYYVPLNEQLGQSADRQIDCLADLGSALGNQHDRLWEMRNGYALASEEGLIEIDNRIDASSQFESNQLRGKLRIGFQWHTEVTIADSRHTVSQAYCSALPIAYAGHPNYRWAKFARLVLEASYEAVFCGAALNYYQSGNKKLYLTLLGGGAFGNPKQWIIRALQRAINIYKNISLDVIIVSYRHKDDYIQKLVAQY